MKKLKVVNNKKKDSRGYRDTVNQSNHSVFKSKKKMSANNVNKTGKKERSILSKSPRGNRDGAFD